ncbi:MAG: hypothetical protein ACI8UO_002839 [Verrucomicrobiales bacterium]|jgi:hypothetical protein
MNTALTNCIFPVGEHLTLDQIVHRKFFKNAARNVFQRPFVRRSQENWRCGGSFVSLFPTRRAKTPAIAGFKSGKSKFRARRRKIIPGFARKGEKFLGRLHANGVGTEIFVTGRATAVAVKTSHWRSSADRERLIINIHIWGHAPRVDRRLQGATVIFKPRRQNRQAACIGPVLASKLSP